MSEEIKIEATGQTRRKAIKTAAQVAVTAPAVGLLLNASIKSASAATLYASGDNDAQASDDPITANNNTSDIGNPGNGDTGTLGDHFTV